MIPAARAGAILLAVLCLAVLLPGPEAALGTGEDARDADDRRARHAAAAEELLGLHFFADGRGMVSSPELGEVVEAFELLAGGPAAGSARPDGRPRSRTAEAVGSTAKGGVQPGRSAATEVVARRLGLNLLDGRIVGLFAVRYAGREIGVWGCALCHAGKAAGRFHAGLGNKTVDVGALGRESARFLAYASLGRAPSAEADPAFARIEKAAVEFSRRLADERFTNLTQGLVPTSMIWEWFYRVQGRAMPEDRPRGTVKVPHLWGYGEKRALGQFSDGLGDGSGPGWIPTVELAAGQAAGTVRDYAESASRVQQSLGDLLPPEYPFAVDAARARRGSRLFRVRCQRCHGSYARDVAGLPIYQPPRWTRLDVVGTDSSRLDGNTPELFELIEASPLADLIRIKRRARGYFAPRLEGIWARFPYLHNGSVPTVMDLLSPPRSRPLVFSMEDAGEARRFDAERLGLTVPPAGSPRAQLLQTLGARGERWVYDTRREEQGNQGHFFPGFETLSSRDRRDLIEYLKTL